MQHCNFCNTPLTKYSQKKFCSVACSTSSLKAPGLQRWLAGADNANAKGGELRRPFRDFLIDEANNKCTQCGWSRVNPHSGKVTLTIDHIDGDACNNLRANLVVLCYNCHTLTSTFNQLNRGRGTRYSPGARARRSTLP